MAISDLVPNKEREMALLEELRKEGRPIKTGELVKRAIEHFPDRLTPIELQRKPPSGTLWWPGAFRFSLDSLKKRGYARRVSKGYWEITEGGIQRLNGQSQPPNHLKPRLLDPEIELLDLAAETIQSIKKGEVKGIVRTGNGKFTIEIGNHIKETEIVLEKV